MRRQKYRQKKQKSAKKIFLLFFGTLLFLTISLTLYFAVKLPKLDKFIFLNRTSDGGGEVIIIGSETASRYIIDGQNILVSSRGLGEYKLDSLWILGEKEGYLGKLAVESVAKNYSIPIYLWRDGNRSNLSISQKIKSKFVKFIDSGSIKTFDGFDLPKSYLVEFVDEDIQENGVLVEIDDHTASQKTIEKVSSILGILGTKISGYSKGGDSALDCIVAGKDKKIVFKIASVFGCEEIFENRNNVKIRLGGKFAERF